MRSMLALAATMAVLVGGGVAVASPTGKTPAAKTPKSMKAPHHCHNSGGLSSFTSHDL